jgi:hypothetical protein
LGWQKNRVLNLGHINNKDCINEIYNLSDITFSLSREESVPGIACESLSCGTPFAGFENVGNLNRMIINDFNGYLVKNFSIDEFAKKINNIKYFSKNKIREDFIKRFDKDFYFNYINLYKESLMTKKSPTISDNNDFRFPHLFNNILSKNIEISDYFKKNIIKFLIYYFKNFREVNFFIIKGLYHYSRRNKFFLYFWRSFFNSKIKIIIKNCIKKKLYNF